MAFHSFAEQNRQKLGWNNYNHFDTNVEQTKKTEKEGNWVSNFGRKSIINIYLFGRKFCIFFIEININMF